MKKTTILSLALVLVAVLTLALAFPLAFTPAGRGEIKEIIGSLPNDGRTVMYTLLLPAKANDKHGFVVINHGHGGGREEGGGLTRIAQTLAEAGYGSIRMDFAGSNQSPDPFTQNVLSLMVSDSNACLNYVLDKYPVYKDKLAILGYSMGGRVAAHILNEGTSPYKALILIAGSVDNGTDMINLFLGGEEARQALEDQAADKGYADYYTPWGSHQQLSKAWFAEMHQSDPMENLGFALPALVIYSEEDTIVPGEVARQAIARMEEAGSPVQALHLEGADHSYGFHGNHPEVFTKLQEGIVDFLDAAFEQ